MFKTTKLLIVAVASAVFVCPFTASAANTTSMACSIAVNFTSAAGNLSYVNVFEVSPTAPFSDDFGTITRMKTFDASMTSNSGTPVVSISFFADVSTFNSVAFDASLEVRDPNKGGTTSGNNAFYSSITGAGVANLTDYILSCKRARN